MKPALRCVWVPAMQAFLLLMRLLFSLAHSQLLPALRLLLQ